MYFQALNLGLLRNVIINKDFDYPLTLVVATNDSSAT
jgi:hypothetical protein